MESRERARAIEREREGGDHLQHATIAPLVLLTLGTAVSDVSRPAARGRTLETDHQRGASAKKINTIKSRTSREASAQSWWQSDLLPAMWLPGWSCFHLVSLLCVRVIVAKRGPGVTLCSGSYHRNSFEYFLFAE